MAEGKQYLSLKKSMGKGIIDIYGEILSEQWRALEGAGTSVASFNEQIKKLDGVSEIIVNINSPGGEVWEGVAIYNILKRHKARVIVNVDGLAASVASVIAMAGDEINMPENSYLMIHNAMTFVEGTADKMREIADYLEKVSHTVTTVYLEKSPNLTRERLTQLLDAETWLTAHEAKALGLADNVVESKKITACAGGRFLKRYDKTPQKFKNLTNDKIIQFNRRYL